jgi:hypothetical protein
MMLARIASSGQEWPGWPGDPVFRLGSFLRRRYDRLWAERISAHQALARGPA